MLSLAKTDDQRAALLLLFATQEFGRPFIAPPDSRLRSRRRCGQALKTMHDPEFLADAKGRGGYRSCQRREIQGLVERLNAATPPAIERLRAIYAETGK